MFSVRRVFVGVLWGLLGMALLTVALTARAGEANLSWTAPTTNCDGTSLTNLTGFSLTYGQKRVELGNVLSTTITGLTPGDWWFSLAAVTPTDRSEFVTVEKTVLPSEFVTKTNKVYTFFRSNGNITVVATPHTVALGTVCDATQSVNGKHRVALEAVVWLGPKLTAALADCG